MQCVQLYFQPFRCNSLLKCALQPKIAKNTKNPYFWVREFKVVQGHKVIDVDTSKKLVTSACHDMQHACAYLPQFSR